MFRLGNLRFITLSTGASSGASDGGPTARALATNPTELKTERRLDYSSLGYNHNTEFIYGWASK